MKLPPSARAEGLTRMGPIHLKGRGLISRSGAIRPRGLERANSVRDKHADFSIVRDRERTLEAFRLVRKIVASGRGDELLRSLGGGRPFPRDFEEIVAPEIDLLRPNRLEPHVGVLPASLLGLPAVIPPVRRKPPPRGTESRATDRIDTNLRGWMARTDGLLVDARRSTSYSGALV